MWFWHILKSWLCLNCATAALCYLLQIKRNQGPSSDCTSPFHVAKCYIIFCLFHEIKLWPLNWLILESKSNTETFPSESVRFLFELTIVQSFVNTAVKWKKTWIWSWFSQYYLTDSAKFQRGQGHVVWPCIRYTVKKIEKNKKKLNNVKCNSYSN